jgi:hypothetical protein
MLFIMDPQKYHKLEYAPTSVLISAKELCPSSAKYTTLCLKVEHSLDSNDSNNTKHSEKLCKGELMRLLRSIQCLGFIPTVMIFQRIHMK